MTFTIENHIQDMAAEAQRRCGLSYELFVQTFSEMVDNAYPEGSSSRTEALEHAGDEYATVEERAATQAELAEQGLCRHGLDKDCCPCGCGDV